ncbi:DUF4097 family beta strand repeat-containing protein [Streptomyces sp. NPDC001691]|uniref:DUF4097 family beta strand repeat-containing protein n=1 Tax=unclassified Streptomyces TaxID=2593676 RepID=UPI000DE89FEC|nr:DUF4097 family beta strand repeat-containing protein [Streptomyces sp. SDr-06]RCH65526.1 hypothetical protein DT019_27460 [Streptomyces sp. SDr-06]
MQKFATTGPITTVLNIPVGRITITATEQTEATLDIQPTNPNKSRDTKAVEQCTVDYTDGVLTIENPVKNQYFGTTGSLDVTLTLPAHSHIQATSGGAELRTKGPLGNVTFNGAHGIVTIDETDTLHLTVHAADVTVNRLTGASDIRVAKGDITITEATHGTLTLRTEAGTITVGTTPATSATLDAATTYGRINNSLTNTQGANPHLRIHATTNYGDINARTN